MNNYYILRQHDRQPRPVDGIYTHADAHTVREVLEKCADEMWAVDLETRGTDASDPDTAVVGIGLASASKVVYFDLTTMSDLGIFALCQWLRTQRLVAFNVNFDGQFLKKLTGRWLNFIGDSYALFKNLASEGWPGQKHNLETAQYEILGWQISNKDDLTVALKERGLTKADMWQLPANILGPYCASDADAALQLWEVLVETCEEKGFDFSLPYHQRVFLTEVRLLEEQQLRGIYVDQQRLQSCHTDLIANIKSSMDAFQQHPQVAPHIARYNQEVHAAWKRAEPPRLTAKGELSKRWEMWRDREERYMADHGFNPNSKQQLEELFYNTLGFKATKFTETGRKVVDRKVLPHLGEPGKLLNKYNLLVKQRGYVEATIAKSARDGLIHPQFNSVGTLTGRLSGTGGLNCFHPKTEVLTERGWIPVLTLLPNDRVWEVDPQTKLGNWATPTHLTQREYAGKLFHFGGPRGELSVTEDHRMAWYGASSQAFRYLETTPAGQLFPQTRRTVLTSTLNEDDELPEYSSEDIWRVAAIQADGSRNKQKWTIGVKKTRKIIKLTELFGPPSHIKHGVHYWYVRFQHPLLNPDKTLNLRTLSARYRHEFLEALSFWDGNKIPTTGLRVEYNSMIQYNVDQVVGYFARCGFNASSRKYKCARAYITDNVHRDIRKSKHVRIEDYSGPVGCLSVPKGHVLVRSEGTTWVVGQCQQMPKTPEFLYAWRARPGHKLVQLDFAALEPTLLAEFSRDKAMWEIYGPNAKPNDIYLYVAAKIPALGKEIVKYYDPGNPTKEGIALAKKHCKRDRSVAKIVQLSSSYGAGAKKIHETLVMAGIDITLSEVRQIHRDYWRLFSGVKRFAGELENMWAVNGGFVFNVLGRPIPVAEDYLKDLLNRQIQSSGHDVLQLFIWHIDRLRRERNLPWQPWLIDMHDEVFVECPEEFALAVAESFRDAMRAVNEELGMEIQLKGDPEIIDNMAEVKCENYAEWLANKESL